MIDQVLVLPIIGIIFVVEMFSVIAQLLSKKLRNGKRILKAAPIHHHFEALGWGESKVTMRLWIIGGFCAFLGVIVGVIG
jgi:phospho-N-acetylmuramoyl-pentapeptide-transferase